MSDDAESGPEAAEELADKAKEDAGTDDSPGVHPRPDDEADADED